MGERRGSTRQRSLLKGCIYFNGRLTAIDCLVRDVSSIGARLIFSEAVIVPDAVELSIPQKKRTLAAHVQWRRGQEAGVVFSSREVPPQGLPVALGDLAQRMENLEQEVAALRGLVRRLQNEVARGSVEGA
jgi:hypothetical protein